MKIDVSVGEVVDKITILQIKNKMIKDEVKLKHINYELDVLTTSLNDYYENSSVSIPTHLIDRLRDINQRLWDAEDILREKEKRKEYDEEFVKYAVLDAKINDERFLVKNEINNYSNSKIKEQKSYDGLYTAN